MKYAFGILLVCVVSVGVWVAWSTRTPATPGLDAFTALTQEDPLLYAPYFDTAPFTAAVRELRDADNRLRDIAIENITKKDASYSATYASLIKNHALFPTDFLAILPALSKDTEAFLAEPNAQRALRLLDSYDRAADAYSAAASSTLAVFAAIDEYVPKDQPLLFFFTDSVTSARIVHEDMKRVYENGLALKADSAARRACLLGTGECIARTAPETSPLPSSAQTIPSDSVRTLIRSTLPFRDTEQEVVGPFAVTSSCWQPENTAWNMYAVFGTKDGTTRMMPKLAETSYYRRISPNATDPISTALTAQGLGYYSQIEGTTYECTELSFYPRLLALSYAVRENIHETALEHAALLRNPFGQLAPALYSLASFTDLLTLSQKLETEFILSPHFLYSTRTAYGLTFMPYAASVWRTDATLTYLVSPEARAHIRAESPFVTITTLLREGYSEDAIRAMQINQQDFIEGLAEKKR